MPEPMTVTLDAEMQEIIQLAVNDGDGDTPEAVLRLALRDWWGRQLLDGYSREELDRMGKEIVADTRPGRPVEEVWAELTEYCHSLEEHRAVDAA